MSILPIRKRESRPKNEGRVHSSNRETRFDMNTCYARSCIIIKFPLGATIKAPPSYFSLQNPAFHLCGADDGTVQVDYFVTLSPQFCAELFKHCVRHICDCRMHGLPFECLLFSTFHSDRPTCVGICSQRHHQSPPKPPQGGLLCNLSPLDACFQDHSL